MIVYPASYVLSAAVPLRNPRIGYQTYTFALAAAAVTASSETASGPKDAPLRPETAEYWEAGALPATWQLDLGANRNVDYIGIAAHTIGSLGLSVGVALGTSTDFAARVTLPGVSGNYASTPDSVANSITGDIDLRAKVSPASWTPAVENAVISKWYNPTSQASYILAIAVTGKLRLYISPNGSTGNLWDSSVATGLPAGVHWIRATRAASTGTVIFYTSEDGVTWTQLGTSVAGTAGAIFDGTAALTLSGWDLGTASPFQGSCYYADVRNAIGAALPVAKFDPSAGVTDATSFVSGTGETWTINVSGGTPARLINPRFGGSADILPANDSPILFLDVTTLGRYLQLSINGASATMPKVAVVYIGVALAMAQEIEGRGFMPTNLSRQTVLQKSLSRGGQFLGQGVRRNGVTANPAFKLLESSWYRANFDPFVKASRGTPYFLAWCPQDYPQDVGYVWSDKDIVGHYLGNGPWIEVAWACQGIGND